MAQEMSLIATSSGLAQLMPKHGGFAAIQDAMASQTACAYLASRVRTNARPRVTRWWHRFTSQT